MRDLKALYFEYLDRYRTMSLATGGLGGQVNASTVCYATEDSGDVVFAADKRTLKIKNLVTSPKVAATMDDGGKTMLGVQLRGNATILQQLERDAARDLLKKRHPDLSQFYDNPELEYVRLAPVERFLVNFSWGVEWRQPVKLS